MKKKVYSYKSGVRSQRNITFIVLVLLTIVIVFSIALAMLYSPRKKTILTEERLSYDSTVVNSGVALYDFSKVRFPSQGLAALGTLRSGVIRSNNKTSKPVPMASITKVITAMAVLEKAPISQGSQGDTIRLTSTDEQYYEDYISILGTVTNVVAGEEITQYQALQSMLLASSNNITDTLVDYYFVSNNDFIKYTNNMLANKGFEYTQVDDATGFSPNSVSTPQELIKLGQLALNNAIIADIVRMPEASLPVAGTIPNYNVLIDQRGVTGIKAGNTDEAGLCLLFSSIEKNKFGENVTIIGVVMGINDADLYRAHTLRMLNDAKHAVSAVNN